jgi:hypothetical protein
VINFFEKLNAVPELDEKLKSQDERIKALEMTVVELTKIVIAQQLNFEKIVLVQSQLTNEIMNLFNLTSDDISEKDLN